MKRTSNGRASSAGIVPASSESVDLDVLAVASIIILSMGWNANSMKSARPRLLRCLNLPKWGC